MTELATFILFMFSMWEFEHHHSERGWFLLIVAAGIALGAAS